MSFEAADAIADLLNGLLREGWVAETRGYQETWLVDVYDYRESLHVLHTPAEAAEFIKEHLG